MTVINIRDAALSDAGRFHNCGDKFGRWYDMIWMEKIIGEHRCVQSPVRSYAETKTVRIGTSG